MPTEWGARALTRNGLRPPGAPITVCSPIPVKARIAWHTGEEVVDFINASLATGFAEPYKEPEPEPEPQKPTGLFGRLRGK